MCIFGFEKVTVGEKYVRIPGTGIRFISKHDVLQGNTAQYFICFAKSNKR
jgi:hypothetical protein